MLYYAMRMQTWRAERKELLVAECVVCRLQGVAGREASKQAR